MGLAQKLLERMGWREGEGLGRNRQGISTPLIAQKRGDHAAVIVNAPEPKARRDFGGDRDRGDRGERGDRGDWGERRDAGEVRLKGRLGSVCVYACPRPCFLGLLSVALPASCRPPSPC